MMPNGSRLPENAVGNTRLPLSDMLFASSYKEITEGLNVRGVKMKDGVVREMCSQMANDEQSKEPRARAIRHPRLYRRCLTTLTN
jgi:hypothetical protein